MGAGVGGLSCAHELIKQGHNVYVFERNPEVGGQARSSYVWEDDKKIHSEYCWHVVAQKYFNLWQLLKEIPFDDEKMVADNLKPITRYVYGREHTMSEPLDERGLNFLCSNSFLHYVSALSKMETLDKITAFDIWKMIQIWTLMFTSSIERLEEYDSILWLDFIDGMSDEAKKWIADAPSIYLGMEVERLSTHTMLKILRPVAQSAKLDTKFDFYSFNGPINDQWFDPWKRYLTSQGVHFVDATIQDMKIVDGRIHSIIANNYIEVADVYVNALPIESLAKFVPKYEPLCDKTLQTQTQVLYYLDKKIESEPNILIYPDTVWCLMIRPEGALWDVPIPVGKDILSVGIGIWSRPGILHKKPAIECTREEIIEECWHQLQQSKNIFEYIKMEDGTPFSSAKIVETNIWNSFQFKDGKIQTWEPKFSNGVNSLKLRPLTTEYEIVNLYHATGYTRTEANLFNMESACEAGRRAADAICGTNNVHTGRDAPPLLMRPIQKIDSLLNKWGMPHVNYFISGIAAATCVTYLLKGF